MMPLNRGQTVWPCSCCWLRRRFTPPRQYRIPKIRLASYNIHLGIGRDGQFDLERIARVINELDADAIALQEVSLGGRSIDMLDFLGERCGMNAIAGPTLVSSAGEYGNAILTRMPAGVIHRWNISVGTREPRGAIDAHLHHRGMTLRMVATHLGLWPGERRRQIQQLLEIIKRDNRFPTVLLGDLNEWFLWGRPLRWMHRYFKSTPAPATFPSGKPLFALDRIWVDPHRALQSVTAHTSAVARIASDHLPIVARFEFDTTMRKAVSRRMMATAG
jgi:endonuclease/exonuclease/phosphatase family metal-dependent hydrolase